MKTLKTLKRELLNDAKTRAAYDSLADEYAIARELIAARARAGLSQSEVAQRMGAAQARFLHRGQPRLLHRPAVLPSPFALPGFLEVEDSDITDYQKSAPAAGTGITVPQRC